LSFEPERERQTGPVSATESLARGSQNSNASGVRKRQPLRDQPLQFDQRISNPSYLLATPPGLIVVERAIDALRLAMQEVDEGPRQVGIIVFQPGV
jgi:hypothetical protein